MKATRVKWELLDGSPEMKPVSFYGNQVHLYDLHGDTQHGNWPAQGEKAACGRRAPQIDWTSRKHLRSGIYHENATAAMIGFSLDFGRTHQDTTCRACAIAYANQYGAPAKVTVAN